MEKIKFEFEKNMDNMYKKRKKNKSNPVGDNDAFSFIFTKNECYYVTFNRNRKEKVITAKMSDQLHTKLLLALFQGLTEED